MTMRKRKTPFALVATVSVVLTLVSSQVPAVMQYPGLWLYGGENVFYREFNLNWCGFGTGAWTHDEFDEGDVYLTDRSFQLFGPYIGGPIPFPNAPGVVYDDGSVKIENVRKTDHDDLAVSKYLDHVHYRVHLRATCFYSAHRYIRITVTGRKPAPSFAIGGNTGSAGVTVVAGSASTTSDAKGNYSIANLFTGTYLVSASKAGCKVSPPSRSATLPPTATGVDFTTTCLPPPTWTISGNTAVSGVTVAAANASTLSGSSGAYALTNLPSGTYSVTASKAGCAVPPPLMVTVGPNATGEDFKLSCGTPSWQISTVTGLPADAYVNGAWGSSGNDMYLWATHNATQTSPPAAHLMHWNGRAWTQMFSLANASAVSITGTSAGDVWISTYTYPSGPAIVYRSIDGVTWTKQALPPEVGNSLVTSLTGTPNNIQASAGSNRIIRWDGTKFTALSAGGITNGDSPVVMTMVTPTEGYYGTCYGWGHWDGASWTFHANPGNWDFCDLYGIFAMHDSVANLVFFLAGNNNFSNKVAVWQFHGSSFGTGKCDTVLGDPSNGSFICGGIFAGNGSFATATGIFGSAVNNVYVSGKLGYPNAGKLYHYDGTSWQDITATVTSLVGGTLPATTTIFGTAADDIWIPLSDGRVLRYTR